MKENSSTNLDEIRHEIDAIDVKIARLLEKRMDLVCRVADYKRRTGTSVQDTSREGKVYDNVVSALENKEYRTVVTSVYERILSSSRDYQKEKLAKTKAAKEFEEFSEDKAFSCFDSTMPLSRVELPRLELKKYGLIGEKLSHSASPGIHNVFFSRAGLSGSYKLYERPPESLSSLLSDFGREGLAGFNITIPYKTAIMPYLNEISQEAVRVGAVNTVNLVNGKASGYNTDYFGFGLSLKREGVKLSGSKCAVLGNGGSARAVVAFLEDNGAAQVHLIVRNPEGAAVSFPNNESKPLESFKAQGYDLVVNTTPVGMYPNMGKSPLSMSQLMGAGFVLDLIYNPAVTRLLEYAATLGIPYANGLYMLVAQAVSAQAIWNGKTYSSAFIDGVYEEYKNTLEKENK